MNWHLLPLSEVSRLLDTSSSGLEQTNASKRLAEYGKNKIVDKKTKTVIGILFRQLTSFMILILIVVAIISGFIGGITDTIIILAIILVNAGIGFIQEFKAEKAMQALRSIIPNKTRVIRSGNTIEVPSDNLVPGDLILLEAGNRIPADVRFVETHQVKVDESTLTGESHSVEKIVEQLAKGDYPLGDRVNLGFKGTFVTNGRGSAYVTATGMKTELGHIAEMIQTHETLTPLQIRLATFGKQLSIVILLICTSIFLIGWLSGEDILAMLLTSISLAVAAIPEALPALVTIALAFGAKRLIKSNAIVRNLPAVETLGSVTYICTDKTGTLTQNKMTVQEIYVVTDIKTKSAFFQHNALLNAMALNNDVTQKSDNKWFGDATEIALVQYAFNEKVEKIDLEKKFPRVAEFPFDASRKCMTTIHQTEKGYIAITKGAVDALLPNLIKNQKTLLYEFEQKADKMANKGYRVLGYAIKEIDELPEVLDVEVLESSLLFVGLAGMIDPPREEAKQAVAQCKEAGIIPVMITGDHKLTAKAIAMVLGIITSEEDIILSGSKLASLTDQQFKDIVDKVRVYARVNPEQKLKIIKALQGKGHFVAMTGDGVNDAPALKIANIGIAMGVNGTEVSKEAADMILLDDNFATIVIAVKHGRMIFDNILKFIKYILTGNFGEICAIFLAPFFGLPFPLLAIHILWINLVTDGLPGLALASEPEELNIMKHPPKDPKQNIFTKRMAYHIFWVGFLMGMVTLGTQAWAIQQQIPHWQTIAFTVLCFSQMGHVMAIRSKRNSLFTIGLLSNKPLLWALLITITLQLLIIYIPFCNVIFKTQPLTVFELAVTIIASTVVFWAVEIEKWIIRRNSKYY
ncbi:cation-translocating P-type ATPase [Flavobacterium frigoris]|uniref:Calcium-transporting ATPase n=1 Tax=Flavobacterium frigoris (strain PS1) TaxID=1086011 RepID=H7FUD2_FLAFP|nr:cation-translocating P-type ATPase [Flavobacterium frigoris]EIA07809.1 calcium-transporting ATPase [Flavobacterium frigoris PS1]